MIEISHVKFSYGQSIILYDISLTIQPQSITAIIGLNGAGKSTLFNCLSKQSEIQDGKIVGAVTHVLVNDPTRGYGIFIENMLEAAD